MICAGGGGIPTMCVDGDDRTLTGVEAVIDKDLASELLARELDADLFVHGHRRRRRVRGLGYAGAAPARPGHARASCATHSFAAGSMGPKVEAAAGSSKRPAGGPRSARSTTSSRSSTARPARTSWPSTRGSDRRDDMSEFGVHSEVGKLRKVMVHRPDLSLQRLTPTNHDELLFDDVLWVERAQYEHDQFVARMRERGVEVFLLQRAARRGAGRERRGPAAAHRARRVGVHGRVSLVDEVRAPARDLKPTELATHLIGGLTVAEAGLDLAQLRRSLADRRRARRPEHVRPAAAAEHAVHPGLVVLDLRRRLDQPDVLAGPAARGLQRRRDLPGAPDVRRRRLRLLVPARLGDDGRFEIADFGLLSLEGGDVMPIGNGTVLIGHERAHPGPDDRADRQGAVRQGRGRPGDRLRDDQGPGAHAPRHGVHAARPRQGHRLPAGGRRTSGRSACGPARRTGDFHVTVENDFLGAVADALGVAKLHVVETGGDEYQQEREQWDDGNNVVALEPGVVVAYERNTYTIAKMREAGRRGDRDRGLRARQGPRRRALHDLPVRARPDL